LQHNFDLKGMKKVIIQIAAMTLMISGLFSCTEKEEGIIPIPFKTIGKGDSQTIFSKQEKIIKTQDEWETFLELFGKDYTDSFSETTIDFEKYQIIAVFDCRPTGGWNIHISSIKEYPYRIVVAVTVKTPTGYVTDAFTLPYHVVKMPVTAIPIEFSYLHF